MKSKLGLFFWIVLHVLLVSPPKCLIQANRLRQIGVDGQSPVTYADPTQFDQIYDDNCFSDEECGPGFYCYFAYEDVGHCEELTEAGADNQPCVTPGDCLAGYDCFWESYLDDHGHCIWMLS